MSEKLQKLCCFDQNNPLFLSFPSVTQNWLPTNCSGLFRRMSGLQTLKIWTCQVRGAMREKYHELSQPKPKTTDELKVSLQTIWEELPQERINKPVANFISSAGQPGLPAWLPVVVTSSTCNNSINLQLCIDSSHRQKFGASEPRKD